MEGTTLEGMGLKFIPSDSETSLRPSKHVYLIIAEGLCRSLKNKVQSEEILSQHYNNPNPEF